MIDTQHSKFEVITQEDSNGDLLIPLPPPLLEQIGWREGDNIQLRAEGNIWIITKDSS